MSTHYSQRHYAIWLQNYNLNLVSDLSQFKTTSGCRMHRFHKFNFVIISNLLSNQLLCFPRHKVLVTMSNQFDIHLTLSNFLKVKLGHQGFLLRELQYRLKNCYFPQHYVLWFWNCRSFLVSKMFSLHRILFLHLLLTLQNLFIPLSNIHCSPRPPIPHLMLPSSKLIL